MARTGEAKRVSRPRTKGKARGRLGREEVEALRRKLLAKRQQLLEDLDRIEEETLGTGGEAPPDRDGLAPDDDELYTLSECLDTAAELQGHDSALLRDVEAALQRIEDGTYGICEANGKPISKRRLRAIPWARYCRQHAEQREKESLTGQWPRIRRPHPGRG
jgi:DnaK suppressor protein